MQAKSSHSKEKTKCFTKPMLSASRLNDGDIKRLQIRIAAKTPYSSDLAPSALYLIVDLKNMLQVKRLESNN